MSLVARSLRYYWRTNLAVVVGVATAVAVLAGALLVGDSVRGSLRDLVNQRLGRADHLVVSTQFFREALAGDVMKDAAATASFSAVVPIIAVQGQVSDQASGRRVAGVMVYGVDDRFWSFHGVKSRSASGVQLSPALAADLGVTTGATVLVRVERPSAIPLESLHSQKDDRGRTLRFTLQSIVAADQAGEFSLRPQQAPMRAAFVPLDRLQEELGLRGRANTLLVSDRAGVSPAPALTALRVVVRRVATLDDLNLTVGENATTGTIAVQSPAGLLDRQQSAAVTAASMKAGMRAFPVFAYLANSIRHGERQVPYSLIAGIDRDLAGCPGCPAFTGCSACLQASGDDAPPPTVVNDWTARELGVKPGDSISLEYFVWQEPGALATRTAEFRVSAVVPIAGLAADRELAPTYPGISDADTLGDWDPPFPIDLKRVRPVDEDYWKRYRATPKAFIPFDVAAKLWSSRYGDRTSVRVVSSGTALDAARRSYEQALAASVDPAAMGVMVIDARNEALAASRGATDFAEYFTYFSFFLVVSALLLAGLFFKLGLDQRVREVGVLRAVGYGVGRVRWLFLLEGVALAGLGGVVGIAGAIGYAGILIYGLRSWWAGAVGTTAISLHIAPASLVGGVFGGMLAAVLWIWWTLRALGRMSERRLLAGEITDTAENTERAKTGKHKNTVTVAIGFTVLALGLLAAATTGRLEQTSAFFGAGSSLLIAALCALSVVLQRAPSSAMQGRGWRPVARLGIRNAMTRPGRSVLAVAVIAAATFILISVEAFRLDAPVLGDRHSGLGGYSLVVNLVIPLGRDPNTSAGREALGLDSSADVSIEPLRVLPGDDASCLNLYEPTRPRVLGVSQRLIESGRFAFQAADASTPEERANPWLLLRRQMGADVVPIIADANSMTYVLHKKLGDEVVMEVSGRPMRLRLVAALDDSIFQSELLMSEANFIRLFPDEQGYRTLLIDAPPAGAAALESTIEANAADLGADATRTDVRLNEFHQVENTYLSTFQALGGLGLLLGTVGLAAVLMRNVLERRREIALLGAVGYRRPHVLAMVLVENVLLLGLGLGIGAFCAVVAIAPAAAERGGRLPAGPATGVLLIAVLAAGLLSSLLATRVALAEPVVQGLHSE